MKAGLEFEAQREAEATPVVEGVRNLAECRIGEIGDRFGKLRCVHGIDRLGAE